MAKIEQTLIYKDVNDTRVPYFQYECFERGLEGDSYLVMYVICLVFVFMLGGAEPWIVLLVGHTTPTQLPMLAPNLTVYLRLLTWGC